MHLFGAHRGESREQLGALCASLGRLGVTVSGEPQPLAAHRNIDILGKAVNSAPNFGQRSSALENEMIARAGQREEVLQRKAHPEVLFDHEVRQRLQLLRGTAPKLAPFFARKIDDFIHALSFRRFAARQAPSSEASMDTNPRVPFWPFYQAFHADAKYAPE